MLRFLSRMTGLLALLVLLGTASPAHAQEDKAAQIDALVASYYDARLFNGAVLVAENGEVLYKEGFGHANMEWDVPNTPDTKFRIGSVTKQFTAALILQLVEEDKLDLEGTITDYLPDYPSAQGDQVTIHHLLTHTSGIPSYTGLPEFGDKYMREPYKPTDFIKVFSDLDLEFEPGSQWRYNNSGYYLLGVIIEAVTGQPYDKVLRERILDPAGLHDTGYDHYAEVIERRASGYQQTPTGFVNAAYLDTSIPYAAGMMYSTVEDLYQWDRYLYTDQLFQDPATKALMFTPHATVPGDSTRHYGYGWFLREMPVGDQQVKLIEHGGGINGFVTTFMRFVEDEHLVVLMDNTAQGNGAEIAQGIINILYGEPAGVEPTTPISQVLAEIIAEDGIDAAIARYWKLKENEPDAYDFSENQLNQLGYYYLGEGDIETAIAVFKLNVEVFPEGFNTYDSLGEAYMEAGETEQAIANYEKSLELNPGNENAKQMLKKLGAEIEEDDDAMTLSVEVLDRYVGTYQIQPGFNLVITREGTQLQAQATGQPKVDIFPQSETKFYYKVVNAQIEFHGADDGKADGLTLYQGGREMNAPRVESGSQ